MTAQGAQIVEIKDPKAGRKKRAQVWPRFHQLDVVRRLLDDAGENGAGRRYLIQHSAGSGKSNSIAWLAHQLIGLRNNDKAIFDSIIAVTDRRILDQQIRDTIRQFAQVGATVGHAEHSDTLRKLITDGKKIIVSTVQKFPHIVDEIGSEHRGRSFASYRVEKKAVVKIQLPDSDAEIDPVPTSASGWKPEPELDRLSNILKVFNDLFGNIEWTDADRIHQMVTVEIPKRVAADTAYQNAKQNSDRQNARIEHDKALERVMTSLVRDDTELFKQFMDNDGFRRWLTESVFKITYDRPDG